MDGWGNFAGNVPLAAREVRARIGRWLVAHGVNLLVPHLSFTTIRGTRKCDHPQTFSDHSPWYENLRVLNEELGRLCWVANRGRVEQRILVLDPLTTGYCLSRKADCRPEDDRAVTHNAGAPPVEEQLTRTLASVLYLQRDFGELAQELSDGQADFDLGDEYVIEEFGRVEGDVLLVGEQRYGLVVWPERMTNLRSTTAEMLGEYLAAGGLLYGVRPAEITLDGRRSDLLGRWDLLFPDSCKGSRYSANRPSRRRWTSPLRRSRKFAFVANLVPAALLRRYLTTTSISMPIR